jgi:geranylgeranyl diphosphate synthase type I
MTIDESVFGQYLNDTRSETKACLEAYLHEQRSILGDMDQHTADLLIDSLISFCTRGKMFRAAVFGLGFKISDKTSKCEVPILVQAGVELIQTGLLIQDDIVDEDDIRRGLPTMHRMFALASQDWKENICADDANAIGRGLAMMASDLAIVLAYDLFLEAGFSADTVIKATTQFNRNLIKTALGQAMDVSLHGSLSPGIPQILKTATYKTAYYTVVGPMQLGAQLAGANTDLLENINQFGRNIGLAYQLRDDILDVFGNQYGSNRKQGSDIAHNKRTLLIENTLRMTSGKEHDLFLNSLGESNPSSVDMNMMRDIIESSGALTETTKKAENFAKEGKNMIPLLTATPHIAQLLRGVSIYAVCRED